VTAVLGIMDVFASQDVAISRKRANRGGFHSEDGLGWSIGYLVLTLGLPVEGNGLRSGSKDY
jgi:hypothetical protein